MLSRIKNIAWIREVLVFLMGMLSIINKIIPKKKDQILFYSSRDSLDDNTEALYTWFKENGYDKKYKLIVCVPNEKKHSHIYDYKPLGAIAGTWAFLRSKYVFFSYGDFRIKPSKKQIVVNQWHGTPIKNIGKLTNDQMLLSEDIDNFTYILSPSKFFAPIFAKAFGCNINQVLIQGSARIDYFYSKKDGFSCLNLDKNKYSKKILWMPTFRASASGRFHDGDTIETETMLPILDTYSDLENLNRQLKLQETLLIIKIHPEAKFKKLELSNIKVITNDDVLSKGIKLYEFIKEFDALLTDYSSVYCDFLLLDRPIGFTLTDIEMYKNSRGFAVDNVLNYMPGHHIYNKDDLSGFIEDVVSGNDVYKLQRQELLPLFWKYTDGRNCERLIRTLGINL